MNGGMARSRPARIWPRTPRLPWPTECVDERCVCRSAPVPGGRWHRRRGRRPAGGRRPSPPPPCRRRGDRPTACGPGCVGQWARHPTRGTTSVRMPRPPRRGRHAARHQRPRGRRFRSDHRSDNRGNLPPFAARVVTSSTVPRAIPRSTPASGGASTLNSGIRHIGSSTHAASPNEHDHDRSTSMPSTDVSWLLVPRRLSPPQVSWISMREVGTNTSRGTGSGSASGSCLNHAPRPMWSAWRQLLVNAHRPVNR